MSVVALLAAAVMPLGSAHDGVVTDGSLYYLSYHGHRGTVQRLELDRRTGSATSSTRPWRRTAGC